jgi:hypothetical protein
MPIYKRNKKITGSKKAKKTVWLLATLAVVAIIVGLASYLITKGNDSAFDKTSTGHDVNLNPPTPQEKAETEEHKDSLAEKEETTTPPAPPTPSGKLAVVPFITFAGQEGGDASVSAYIPGIFEDDGTCTATFTKGTLSHSQQSKGFRDFKHTTCAPITAPRASFAEGGAWTVILSYSSATASGSSQPRSLTIE